VLEYFAVEGAGYFNVKDEGKCVDAVFGAVKFAL
jgi:hypothetical protein